jgi:hypothetical protein
MNSKSLRLTAQQRQEYRSRDQLADRFDEYGWVPDPISRDLGEDFIVRIYVDGISSGLAFFVQLKSTADIVALETKDEYISYPIPAKDLEHWSVSGVPVFIIVWDVKKRIGYWLNVTDALKNLEADKPRWQAQQTVTVKIPKQNATDAAGLERLKRLVADVYLPIISKDKALEIQFSVQIPREPEAQAQLESMNRFVETGEPVQISGQYVQEFKVSDWWERLYGEIKPTEGGVLTLTPVKDERPIPARLDITPDNVNTFSIPYLDLRVMKRGLKEVTLINIEQPIPFHFEFKFRHADKEFEATVSFGNAGSNVLETREILSFVSAFGRGGKLRLTFLSDKSTFESDLPGGSIEPPPPEAMRLIEDLCLIQERTGCTLKLNPDWSISNDDTDAVRQIVAIIQTGRYVHRNVVATLTLKKEALEIVAQTAQSGQRLDFRFESNESPIPLLGVQVPMGPATQYFEGTLAMQLDELERSIASLGNEESFSIQFVNGQVIEEFENWLPKT